MLLRRCFALAAALAAVGFAVHADDKGVAKETATLSPGNWLLCYSGNGTAQQRFALLKVEAKDGKPTATVESTGPQQMKLTVAETKVVGNAVTLKVKIGGATELAFEGTLDPANPKKVLGSFGDGDRVFRASLEATELTKLEQKDMMATAPAPEAYTAAQKGITAAGLARRNAMRTKDADEKAKLLKEADEKLTGAQEAAAAKYREVVKESADSPFAVAAAEELIGLGVSKTKATADEVAGWAALIDADAARYGARYQGVALGRLASMLGGADSVPAVALKYAEKAAKLPGQSTKGQVAALKVLAEAQGKAGQEAEAKGTLAEVAKLDAKLDAEYSEKVPPFKPEKFAGRKDKAANKVAVMELFTGAQCPPCVAADVGFDALSKAYDPKDVVLIQYHLHIPGPDPLTNPDSVARMGYYSKLAPDNFGGTPSTAFNGKAAAGGGGGMAGSKGKFDEYSELLNKTLEETTEVKLAGTAKLAGADLAINLEVAGLKDPSDKVKLRLILTEENIRYVGGNGLRFHHHVARGLLGTVEGVPVKSLKDGKYATTASLPKVKADLAKYLADYAAERGFPNPDRPLDLKGLKVVALVQDDETGEVLQAVQLDVGG